MYYFLHEFPFVTSVLGCQGLVELEPCFRDHFIFAVLSSVQPQMLVSKSQSKLVEAIKFFKNLF